MPAKQIDSSMVRVRDLLVAQIGKSIEGLEQPGASDDSVHDVRKALKRARAALRLMRDSVGESAYRRQNRLLRDAGRPLRDVRDSKVLLQTFSELKRGEATNESALQVVRELRRERRANRERLERLEPSSGPLHEARRRIEGMSEPQLARAPLAAAVARVYRSGRRAFAKVQQRSTDERLHEWRKQVKYLFNQIDVLCTLGARRFAKLHERAHRLGDLLGDDHDLAVLQQKIIHIAKMAGSSDRDGEFREWSERASRRRSVLQRKAFKLGKRLYSRRPKHMGVKVEKRVSGSFKSP